MPVNQWVNHKELLKVPLLLPPQPMANHTQEIHPLLVHTDKFHTLANPQQTNILVKYQINILVKYQINILVNPQQTNIPVKYQTNKVYHNHKTKVQHQL
jgi:hypothetical protein